MQLPWLSLLVMILNTSMRSSFSLLYFNVEIPNFFNLSFVNHVNDLIDTQIRSNNFMTSIVKVEHEYYVPLHQFSLSNLPFVNRN